MENSRPFIRAEPHAADSFYTLVSGERLDQHGAPARTAWEIERLAALRGWPAGESLGSEAVLRGQLNVSRETLREAIRIVESRGAMRMRRGRSGGLTLVRPPTDRIAASLAAYLRATGITADELAQSVRGLDKLLSLSAVRWGRRLPHKRPGESPRHWLVRASGRQTYRIYVSALDKLTTAEPAAQAVPPTLERALARRDAAEIFRVLAELPFVPSREPTDASAPGTHARAGTVAIGMIERARAKLDLDLGNEASLCEEFATSRAIVRQALRILQDLDMIHVRRGRGGGYTLKQPLPIGIIRQLFAWLAARNCDPFVLNALVRNLNATNVRLAGERLAAMPAGERERHCRRIDRLLAQSPASARFIRLQQSLAEIAACPMVDTFARCVVSYQARSYGDFPQAPPSPVIAEMELAIVAALRTGEIDLAERILRELQDKAQDALLQSLGCGIAAE